MANVREDWMPCDQCDMYFRNAEGLKRHEVQKHPRDDKSKVSLSCSYCPKTFSSVYFLHPHVNRYHLEEIENVWVYNSAKKMFLPPQPLENPNVSRLPSDIECHFCDVVFDNVGALASHANAQHPAEVANEWLFDSTRGMYYPGPVKQPGVRPRQQSQCAFCPLMFMSKSVLYKHANAKHMEEVRKNWFFDTIEGSYYPVPEEQRRKKLPSNGLAINCEFCFKSLKYGIVTHANRFHHEVIANIWPGHCVECNMYFPSIASYNSHSLSKHKITYQHQRFVNFYQHVKSFTGLAHKISTS